ncbi:MAG: 30S ribosome-binding factor RbfA [Euryhalocaulis sp.]|uniref:30S ribosome-binding factor RbfA n=1 Tax=Euryhalocaulis sp. TaxID=2744307 RepID=UPI00181D9F82|nr:30S ribosome-binding factor RbfA [Euryhalocaulis sp.]MBA4801194.1 30S ribosome-binding factor RbfA [Euryhalocaulis sp.]
MKSRGNSKKGPTQRQLRAGELIRHAIAEILIKEAMHDPALEGVSVTVSEVRVSPDLKHATVFCAPLADQNHEEVLAGLNRAAGFLRHRLGDEIETKFTPSLKFVHDESFQAASDMDALMRRPEVAQDLDD